MVDQNATPQQPPTPHEAEPSQAAATGLSSPSVVQAGEWMLIFSLILIFAVCCAVAAHFWLKRRKRRRPVNLKSKKKNKQDKKNKEEAQQPELQSSEKKFAELVGTPLCEMGDSEPRHEMEDAEVLERFTFVDLEDPRDNPVLVSPLDRDLEAGTMFGHMSTVSPIYQPEPRQYAVYWGIAL